MTTATLTAAGLPPAWADGLLVCQQVHDVTADVKTFVLAPTEPRLFRHDPGQFLTLCLDIDGEPVERCYTLSSAPTRPDLATITVKRVPGGHVSNWLHDHLAPGGTVWARGPLGRFTISRHPAPKYLFLSAGSGVTPLMSMTRTLYDLAHPVDVVLVHSARTFDDIIFRRELDFIAAASPNFRTRHLLDDRGEQLNAQVLRAVAPDFAEREVFTCGPPGYMAAVRGMLTSENFDLSHHHEESFTFEAPASPESEPGTGFKVQLARTGRTIECDAETPVLAAAAREGITLPASCAQGLCGTCKTTLLSGSVDMRHAGGIRAREIANNKILLCCSTPREDVVIDA
ncbi:2Fe-2S iron-sulfur cluster-binding protein [Streptomyces sp. NPDC102360]|uniref:2Fe-2S iron-sulfur cluster-binding protein n=1 Tax=Streptomyces sp. NPDC102360 TaxID=3366160 RepID=UPI003826545D